MVGSDVRAASAPMASPRPRSDSSAGRMPRARSRSSPIASLASPRAFSTSSRAPSGSRSKRSSAMPRSSARATRRACAPSCRSRSMRVQLGGGGVDGAGARLGQDLDALLELAAAGAEHDPRERAAGGRRAAHQRGGDRQQDDADRHGQEGVAPRVDLEEAELGGVGLRQRPPPGGHEDQPERGRPRGHRDREVGDADRQQQQMPAEVLPRRRVREERLEALHEPAVGRAGRRPGSARPARAPRGGARPTPSSARCGW